MSNSCCNALADGLLFACAGGSNVGQISNAAAIALEQSGVGRLYCLAGIGGHVEGMVQTAQAAPFTIAIDGCPVACARKTLEAAGIEPTLHVVVTDLGIAKEHCYEWSPEDVARVVEAAGGSASGTCCGASEAEQLKRAVRETYGQIATGGAATASVAAERLGYAEDDLVAVPEGANLGLGCGNPVAVADLQPGETVLDLGSGGGLDCFLAAKAVGPTGHVIGVDMTAEMIERARANAERVDCPNVAFRLGEIERLPVEDGSVDVVISNCVVNLVPDKRRAFAEAHRVLRPGGRLHLSDIVLTRPLPTGLEGDLGAYCACLAGALLRDEYLAAIVEAGFVDLEVVADRDATELLAGCCAPAPTDAEACECDAAPANCCGGPVPDDIRGLARSLTLSARRPA